MKNNRISEIILENRQTGSSTWILKSAVNNPNCIIITGTLAQAKGLEYEYYRLISNVSLFKKLIWWLLGREHPKFMMMQNDFRGYKLPIIFDNSALYLK